MQGEPQSLKIVMMIEDSDPVTVNTVNLDILDNTQAKVLILAAVESAKAAGGVWDEAGKSFYPWHAVRKVTSLIEGGTSEPPVFHPMPRAY